MESAWPEQQLFVRKPKFWLLGSEVVAALLGFQRLCVNPCKGLPATPSSNGSQKVLVINTLVFHKTMPPFGCFWGCAAGGELHQLPDVSRWTNTYIPLRIHSSLCFLCFCWPLKLSRSAVRFATTTPFPADPSILSVLLGHFFTGLG